MKTPAAKAKGMKPDTNTMKATKTPAAKAKGMKLKTKTMNVMKTPVAKENMKARRLPAAKADASPWYWCTECMDALTSCETLIQPLTRLL